MPSIKKIYTVRSLIACTSMTILLCSSGIAASSQQYDAARSVPTDALVQGFQHPPAPARLRCYWWWLNGHTTEATITRDLEEMSKKGYGGALLVDANGANQNGNDNVPPGPEFGSPAWTKLYVHALKEADRLGLEITLNITSGWNLGSPLVKPKDASKLLTWSRVIVMPKQLAFIQIEMPPTKNGFYQQIAVLAYPLHRGADLPGDRGSKRSALPGLSYKSASAEMGFSMPDATSLLTDTTPEKKDEDVELSEIQDITHQVDTDGTVHWAPPASNAVAWEILRIGYTDSDARISTSSDTWQGLAIDYLDPHAFDLYWKINVEPLLAAAKPYVGKSLKYVATDSWELGGTNWTAAFGKEFNQRRGYDPTLYLPVVAGRIVGSRDLSTRFLTDLRRTVGDLVNTHYDRMALRAKSYGLGIQCESGGPHGAPIDALETFRSSAVPQTEYWAMSKEHRTSDEARYFVKEGSSAAHIYGRPFAAAEGMTSIGNHWNESIGMNLRPSFDQALTEGMNRLVWHAFTSSPPELGLPGQEYFAGTHMNPNVTWWRDSTPFFQYLNRSQFLMQQGLPVSDVLYYYGDNVPNFVRLKRDDPAKILPGYDYDVTDTEALLHRFSFEEGVLSTPEGIRYRALALPASRILPLAVLQFMQRYVEAGGTLIGKRPLRSQGITSASDEQAFQLLANHLWRDCETSTSHHIATGKGQLYCTAKAHEALQAMGVPPDLQEADTQQPMLDYAHRRTAQADIYFIRNTLDTPVKATVLLRSDKGQPELFHADTGAVETTLLFSPTSDARTMLPLSLDARGSIFIILRHHTPLKHVTRIEHNGSVLYDSEFPAKESLPASLTIVQHGKAVWLSTHLPGSYNVLFSDGTSSTVSTDKIDPIAIAGPWTLNFPPNWGAPPQIQLDKLQSWTAFNDAGVRYFSGRATYRTSLQLTASQANAASSTELNLGEVHEVAAVRINGGNAGILWKSPYIVPLHGLLHAGENEIEIDVTNLWPNRLIGDAQESQGKHYTWTNIRQYTKDSPLLPSGIIGPVELDPVYNLPLAVR
jgi:hypothetical protein